MSDAVNHPSHYNQGAIEVIDFIEDRKMNFNVGNAIKYICRAPYKGKCIEDLRKAIFYLSREVDRKAIYFPPNVLFYEVDDFVEHLPIELQDTIYYIDGAFDLSTIRWYEKAINELENYINKLEQGD